MTDLFWPGDERAGDLFSDAAFLAAMVAVEEAWLDALVGTGIAPAAAAKADLLGLVGTADDEWLADDAEAGGNPVIAARRAAARRPRRPQPDAARWLHRGLTSQDVVDTALMLCARRRRRPRSSTTLRDAGRRAGRPRRGAPRHADGRRGPSPSTPCPHVRAQGGAAG